MQAKRSNYLGLAVAITLGYFLGDVLSGYGDFSLINYAKIFIAAGFGVAIAAACRQLISTRSKARYFLSVLLVALVLLLVSRELLSPHIREVYTNIGQIGFIAAALLLGRPALTTKS